MSTSIKQQVLAHLEEQEKVQKEKAAAAQVAAQAKQKAESDDLAKYLKRCQEIVEPAMREFSGLLEGRVFQGKVETDRGDRGNPMLSFLFSSATNPRLASLLYRRSGQLGSVDVVSVISNVPPDTKQVPLDDLTKELVAEHLFAILKKLKGK